MIVLMLCLPALLGITVPRLAVTVLQSMSSAALHQQEPARAESYLKLALGWGMRDATTYDLLGTAHYRQGEMLLALDAFAYAATLDSGLASAQNNLGAVLIELGHPRPAIPWLTRAVELNPISAEAFTNLGNAYLESGLVMPAVTAYQRAVELDPTQVQAKSQWATLAYAEGRYEAARLAWETVAMTEPDWPGVSRGLGAVAAQQERPDDALMYLTRAIEQDPSDWIALYYLGLTYEDLSRPAEALDAFEQVLVSSVDPELAQQARLQLFALAHGP
jgi:tetratricopeptide (TPR) repeat protein